MFFWEWHVRLYRIAFPIENTKVKDNELKVDFKLIEAGSFFYAANGFQYFRQSSGVFSRA
jgi:hypothetical protein